MKRPSLILLWSNSQLKSFSVEHVMETPARFSAIVLTHYKRQAFNQASTHALRLIMYSMTVVPLPPHLNRRRTAVLASKHTPFVT